MKKKLLIIIPSAFLISAKCTHQDVPIISATPVVCCIGLDVSQTMAGYPPFTQELLSRTCNHLKKVNGDVCLAIKKIGNPSNEGFERLMLRKVPVIDSKATMSVRGKQRKDADLIKNENERRITAFLDRFSIVSMKDDKTCLNEFLADAQTMLNEPQFESYKKILCIYSDGYPDTNGDDIHEPLICNIEGNIVICTIGWKNDQTIQYTGTINSFADIEGFLSYLETLLN